MNNDANEVLLKAAETWQSLMLQYADAMCAAQILERELVLMLAALRVRSGEIKGGDNFDWAFTQMLRMKPWELVASIRGSGGGLTAKSEKEILDAINGRNFLAHKYFHQYGTVMDSRNCRRASNRLRRVKSDLENAFKTLNPLRQKLESKLGIRSKSWSEFVNLDVAAALISFKEK